MSAKGVPVARYHLVTPWTPTSERYADFVELTNGSVFPTQWDGEAFINGLADQFPASMDRFVHGPGSFERFVMQKAVLASSPVERADELTMLEAIGERQSALDSLRDSVSDTYYINHGMRTVVDSTEVPLPAADDAAVYHRMTFLGEGRWKTESIVPRSPNSAETDPINLEVQFLVAPGTPEEEALTAWREWGTPFENLPARTVTHGGPFAGEADDRSHLSFVQPPAALPPLRFIVYDEEGTQLLNIELRVITRTRGAETGWLFVEAETPSGTARFEFRARGERNLSISCSIGSVEGKDPQAVLAELDLLERAGMGSSFSILASSGASIARGSGFNMPDALEGLYRPIAAALADLQNSTTQTLTMPDVAKVSVAELRALQRYQSIYAGTAYEWTWETASLKLPDDVDEAQAAITELSAQLSAGHIPIGVELPVIRLGGREYLIERPLVTSRRSVQIAPGTDLESLTAGSTVPLVPRHDDGVISAAVTDWTPDSPSPFPQRA